MIERANTKSSFGATHALRVKSSFSYDVRIFIINFKNIAVILQLQEHLGKQALDSLHYLPEY